MAIYNDNTMDVLCNGRVERRPCILTARLPLSRPKSMTTPPDVQPVLQPGEDVQYFNGSPIPHIVPIQWPEPERCGTLVERIKWDGVGGAE
jgi:hypothetical protein